MLDEPSKCTETLGGDKQNDSKRLKQKKNNYSVGTPKKRNYPALSSCNPVVFRFETSAMLFVEWPPLELRKNDCVERDCDTRIHRKKHNVSSLNSRIRMRRI